MTTDFASSATVLGYLGPAGDHNEKPNEAVPLLLQASGAACNRTSHLLGHAFTRLEQTSSEHLDGAREQLASYAAAVIEQLKAGHGVVCVNGRCATSLATVPAVMSIHPDAVLVWLDAHADRNVPGGSPTDYLGGMAVSGPLGWWDSGLGTGLTPERLVLVGTRSIDDAEQELIERHQIPVLTPEESDGTTLNQIVGGRPVYFHIDCDVLEPGLFQTDYHEPDGLTLGQLEDLALALAQGSDIVGVEIAEWEGRGSHDADDLLSALAPLLRALEHPPAGVVDDR
ncbi:arginase/N-omega-hydroxy-L-arginine amidinohydrolase [Nocardioides daedukensis]|uniref:Arginase/N-omega-hydroxy-L-arginine amidinohydrolase n=1 Tax=Nocardioides daedukensis TaxID=634462 RepID=A0A7Y9RZ45_9ACTN|nr:arginase family protein [Nocardioides daedukensis]NYG59316.1 arginase/N-omega-hydroxy-L-arginine amidinohydrolase [Nocardioides daedukensis]